MSNENKFPLTKIYQKDHILATKKKEKKKVFPYLFNF